MKIKVCFLVPGFDDGGAQRQCIHLLNQLQLRPDLDISLIHFMEGRNFSLLRQNQLTVVRLHSASLYDPRNIRNCVNAIKRLKPHIVFSWLHSCDVYASFVKISEPTVKWLLAERDSHYPLDLRYEIRRRVGLRADMIVCNSGAGALYWRRNGAPDSRIHVIPNIAVLPKGRALPELQNHGVVTYAGRLEPQKNIAVVAEAFCLLAHKHSDTTFLIIGDGSRKEEAALIVARHACNNVSLIPYSPSIGDYFAATDVFVNVSLHEGMPNTVIENILYGNRIVASNIAEHRAILGASYPFYVSDIQDPAKVAKTIDAALVTPRGDEELMFARNHTAAMSAKAVTDAYSQLFYSLAN